MSEEVSSHDTVYRFDSYRLDHRAGLCRLNESGQWEPIVLGSRALGVLRALLERHGELVTKSALMDAVWPGIAIEESNLTVQISAVRRALDGGRGDGGCIRTVIGRGYRFVPLVTTELSTGATHETVSAPAVSRPPMMAGPPTVAVLPFENFSRDSTYDLFRDGLADDMITELSHNRSVFVIARTSSFAYKGRSTDVKLISRELGVDYVIDGSVRRDGSHVRITAQLIDARTGVHVWVERFDVEIGSGVTIPDEVIGRVVRVLSVKLNEDVNRRIEAMPERDWTPDVLVMRGHAYTSRPISDANRNEAIRCFELALDGDPNSVDAMLGIAWVLIGNVADGWSRSSERDTARAERLLLDVLHVDGDIPEARTMMGVMCRLRGRLDEARHELEKAIEMDPHNPRALCQLGFTLALLGRPESGIPYIETGLRLAPRDPATPAICFALGYCHLLLEHIEEAIVWFRKSRAENPRPVYSHIGLAAALGLSGELAEAASILRHAAEIKPEFNSISSVRGLPWHVHPKFIALFDKTVGAGLQRAGLPNEGPLSGPLNSPSPPR